MKKLNLQGFTLIEILVTIGIASLFIIGIGSILVAGFKYRAIIWEQLSTQNEGRKIVQDFVNEIRTASYSNAGAYPLEIAQAQQIAFYSNIDNDVWRERVRYFVEGTVLKRGITKPNGTPLTYSSSNEIITDMVHDIANSTSTIFYYYDQNYNGLATSSPLSFPIDTSLVRMIRFSLKLDANPHFSPEPLEVEAIGGIRNLKNN